MFELEIGMVVEKLLDDAGVLLGLQTASAVNQNALRPESRRGPPQEFELRLPQPLELGRPQAPAQIDPAPHNSGIGTRRIHQDAIEHCRWRVVWSCAIVSRCWRDFETLDSKASAVFVKPRQTAPVDILGHNVSTILHALGDMGCLTARGGTKVEHAFAGLGIQFPNREQSARVLHIK